MGGANASIRQRSGTWQARVIREGFPTEVKTCATRSEVQKCAGHIESAMDDGGYRSGSGADRMLLGKYSSQVFPSKRGRLDGMIRIIALNPERFKLQSIKAAMDDLMLHVTAPLRLLRSL